MSTEKIWDALAELGTRSQSAATDELVAAALNELATVRQSEDTKDKEIERLKARCRAWRIQWATGAREHRRAESTVKQKLERMQDVYADLRELGRAMAYGLDTSEIKRRSTDGLVTDLYRNCGYRVLAHKIDAEFCGSRLDALQAKVAELERVRNGEAIARRQEARLLTEARAELERLKGVTRELDARWRAEQDRAVAAESRLAAIQERLQSLPAWIAAVKPEPLTAAAWVVNGPFSRGTNDAR